MRIPNEIECLYIDFDSYFASVEKQLRPELRNRPVGVIPMDTPATGLIAACYVAKAAGATRGTSVRDARALCPDIALPVARHDEYVKMHHRILAELDRHVPVKRIWSVDEMECTLIGRERKDGVALAHRIRKGLAHSIGPWVTPSIGLAPNQFLAKVAAEMNKPKGLVVLRPEDLPGPLFDLELTDLPGIASAMRKRLEKAGVNSVEDLWNLSPKHARAIWNSVEGERMWAQLRGHAISRPETTRGMFGHGRVLSPAWRTLDKARDCARLLTVKAARRMRREGYTASTFSLSLSTRNGERWRGDLHLFPSRDDHTFLVALNTLFEEAAPSLARAPLLKVHVMLTGITSEGERSEDLFEHKETRTVRARWERLTDAMDGLNAKHEKCVISIGPRAEPPGGYAGAKIAFGRVPELEDF
ncbi:MAG: hypothetical protein V3V03_05985 [Hyphomonadaceae bacterium]